MPEKDQNTSPLSLATILRLKQSPLARLLVENDKAHELDRFLQTILPEKFKAHCQVVQVKNMYVTIAVANNALANECRFMQLEWLAQLRKQPKWAGLVGIKFIVSSVSHSLSKTTLLPPHPRPLKPLTIYTLNRIQETSQNITNEKVADVLRKIATTADN